MPVVEAVAKARKRPQSRVTGLAKQGITGWLEGGDKRGPIARRFRDLVSEITSDLGGPTGLSENQRQIIRRIASMSVWCESVEAEMADGKEINIGLFQTVSNALRRLCESIGLERRPKPVLDITEYIRMTPEQRRAHDEGDDV